MVPAVNSLCAGNLYAAVQRRCAYTGGVSNPDAAKPNMSRTISGNLEFTPGVAPGAHSGAYSGELLPWRIVDLFCSLS